MKRKPLQTGVRNHEKSFLLIILLAGPIFTIIVEQRIQACAGRCGGRIRIQAAIRPPEEIRRINCFGLPSDLRRLPGLCGSTILTFRNPAAAVLSRGVSQSPIGELAAQGQSRRPGLRTGKMALPRRKLT